MISYKFKKMFSYYKPYKKEFFWDLICSLFYGLTAVAIPFLIQYEINKVVKFQKEFAIKITSFITLTILSLFILMYLCTRYIRYQGTLLATKIEIDMKNELFAHFQKQNFDFFDSRKTGKLISYITTETGNLSKLFKTAPGVIIDFFVRCSVALTMIFVTNWILGILVLAFIGVFFTLWLHFLPKIQKNTDDAHELFSELISNIEESLSGIKVTQSFCNESKEINKFKDDTKTYLSFKKKIEKLISVPGAVSETFISGFVPFVTTISMFFIAMGKFKIEKLIVVMLYIDLIINPMFSMMFLMQEINENWVGFDRVLKILSIKPKIVDSPNAVRLSNIRGSIEFKNVSFNYGGENIFENLSLKIKMGEYVALIGSSGVGKTTLCNLIPRFYDVQIGEILIDGENTKNIKLEDLRKNIGFVHQDTFLFSGTILENIRFGKINATQQEVIKSAKHAYAHDFIMSLPEQYDTKIGQRGLKLSGGQKQRLSIARVFLKNPPILIFDEATSSLDNESERFIQKSMEELAKNRTTITIAHRLSTIQNAHRIVVLEKGKIVEEGTHEELINKNGAFAAFLV